MKTIRRNALTVILMLAAMAATSFAQGPLHKRINYTIDAPYALKMGDYMLPAGKYVLFQLNLNNPNLFALYQEDLAREPIALIHTVRIDFQGSRYPEDTKILLTMDEERVGRRMVPEVKGWTIPGTDGWEIVGVVSRKSGVMTRID
jgi:hypothetical protein